VGGPDETIVASPSRQASKERGLLAFPSARVGWTARLLASPSGKGGKKRRGLASPKGKGGKKTPSLAFPSARVRKETKLLARPDEKGGKERHLLAFPSARVRKGAQVLGRPGEKGGKIVLVVDSPTTRGGKETLFLAFPSARGSKKMQERANNRSARPRSRRQARRSPRSERTVYAHEREDTKIMATQPLASLIADLAKLADALETNMPNEPFGYASKTYAGPEVIAKVRGILAEALAVRDTRALLHDYIVTLAKSQRGMAEFLAGLRRNIRINYGNNLTKLAEFALEPVRKRGTPTGDEILLRVTKAKATRKKRRTMGKKQRKAIKGSVTGVVITPVKG
jgi:hypothetical protein